MEQVRAQRASARHGAGERMMRARRTLAMACAALAACTIATTHAAAQSAVELQALRHGAPPAPAKFDVDSAIARASELRRHNRRAAAAEVMRQAVAAAPDRLDARRLFDQLQQELHGGEVLVAVNYRSWRTQLPDWKEGVVALRQNTPFGAAIVRGSHLERAAIGDDQIQVEAYPAFPHGYLALGGGVATHATLYAHTSASAEVYGSLTDNLEGSLGYRRMNFTSPVNMVGGSLGTYLGNNLLAARVTHVANDGGTSVLLSARHFIGDDAGQFVGLRFGTGSVPVEFRTPTDFAVRFSQSAGVELRVFLGSVVVLSTDSEIGRDGLAAGGSSEYGTVRLGLGVRY